MNPLRLYWPFLVFAAALGLAWSAIAIHESLRIANLWAAISACLVFVYWFSGETSALPDRVLDTTHIAEVCEHFAPRCTVHTDTGTYLARVTVLVGWRMRIPFYARTIQRRIYCELRKRGPFDAVFQVEVRR